MKDADRHRLSVAQVNQMPRDMLAIQINVHDFDAMIELLQAHGFKNMAGEAM